MDLLNIKNRLKPVCTASNWPFKYIIYIIYIYTNIKGWGENARKSRCLYTLLGCAQTMSHDISTHKQLSIAQPHVTTISAPFHHYTTTMGDNDNDNVGPDDANALSGLSLSLSLSPIVVVWWWKEAEMAVMWHNDIVRWKVVCGWKYHVTWSVRILAGYINTCFSLCFPLIPLYHMYYVLKRLIRTG